MGGGRGGGGDKIAMIARCHALLPVWLVNPIVQKLTLRKVSSVSDWYSNDLFLCGISTMFCQKLPP